jgi:hypothetical protein
MSSLPQKSDIPDNSADNYSVDEMMGKLRKGERHKRQSDSKSEGELVTRENGTQAIKVRRRKRRSKQPPKKQASQTNSKLKWAILGSAAALLVLMGIVTIFIIAKYNGSKFKTTTESNISSLSGAAETTLTQLRVTPVSAKAGKTEIKWGQQSFLKDATFSNIRAHIIATSFFSDEWRGEEIVASIGEVHLKTPDSGAETSSDEITSPYRFGAYRCNQLDLFFGSEKSAPSITEVEVSLRRLNNGEHQIVFHDGLMKVNHWPPMKLSSGIVMITSLGAQVEALLKAGRSHNGELTFKGLISKTTTSPARLDVKAKNYPIQELLGKDLGRFIQGELQSETGSFTYNYSKQPDEALSFILPFNSTEIRFEGLPMFKVLNKLIADTAYISPLFSRCRGTILRTAEGLSLNDLEFINNSLLILKGNIDVDTQGKLTGKLSIGIPQSTFDDQAPQPFTGPIDGFYHLVVTLSGTTQTPNDNLHQLLKGAKVGQNDKALVLPKEFIQPKKTLGEPNEEDFNELIRR